MEVILDASTVISLSDNCLLSVLRNLTNNADWSFIIPESVKEEVVIRPMNIRNYELNAIRISREISKGTLKIYPHDENIKHTTQEITNLANSSFKAGNRNLEILHAGEAEALGILAKTKAKVLGIDEKNTRFLLEDPEQIRDSMERVLKTKIEIDNDKIRKIQKIVGKTNIIRSAEILAIASNKGLLSVEGSSERQTLEASLYAVRHGGCAVSLDEINQYLGAK